jgi:hypothetical protein
MSSTMRRLRNGVLIVAAVVAVASSSVSTQGEPPIDPDEYWNPNGSQNDQRWIHPFFDISDFSAENVSLLFVNETSSVPFI